MHQCLFASLRRAGHQEGGGIWAERVEALKKAVSRMTRVIVEGKRNARAGGILNVGGLGAVCGMASWQVLVCQYTCNNDLDSTLHMLVFSHLSSTIEVRA